MAVTKIILPTLGLDIEEATIVKWLRKEGDSVVKGEPIVVIETEKAAMEIDAPESGVLRQILQPEGSTVRVTEAIALMEIAKADGMASVALPGHTTAADSSATLVRASPAARRAARELGVDLAQIRGSGPLGRIQGADVVQFAAGTSKPGSTKATPVAVRIAREQGIDLSQVKGTGPAGRIMKGDVLAAVTKEMGSTPVSADSRPTTTREERLPIPKEQLPGRLVPLQRKRRVTAERMALSARSVARVTLNTDVDATELVHLRQRLLPIYETRYGVRLSYDAILVKMVATALAEHRNLNARWTDEGIYLIESINVGVAIAVADGLVVPVIHGADCKSLPDIASEVSAFVEKAREDKLTLEDMTGGTFTLTNLGLFGIDSFTPIVNPPEAAILGVGRIAERPVGLDGQIVLRPTMTLSLSFDHRVVDGAPAARFLQTVQQLLREPYLLI